MSPLRSFVRFFLSIRVAPAIALASILASSSFPAGANAASCTVGETGTPTTSYNLLDLRDLTAYQLIDAADCAACSGGALVPVQLRWQIRYYTSLCPLTFEVTIVASDHGTCPRPDTTLVLCPPFTSVYAASGSAPHVATIPFPPGCCLDGPAFVRVRIIDTGGCGFGTLAFFARSCSITVPCRSYVSFAGTPLDDACTVLGDSPTIAVDASCCASTPARRTSWGGLKLHYR